MLELYVWGPAFSLPSIDAECISATAYLNASIPSSDWVLIPSHDPSSSPTKNFPLLCDGEAKKGGFKAITNYIRKNGNRKQNAEDHLNPKQQADSVAYTSFLHSEALSLADLLLYTSSDNYYYTTGPAWARILPFPLNYTIPPRRRTTARARTAHLGLSSLDVDTAHEALELGQTPSQRYAAESKAAADINTNMPQPINQRGGLFSFKRKTMLSDPHHQALFRLSSLISALLDPLNDLLSENEPYLLGSSHPTSLDCLALGYLSLLLYPETPLSYIREIMRSRYPTLSNYVDSLRDELLRGKTDVDAVIELSSNNDASVQPKLALPWTSPPSTSLFRSAVTGGKEVLLSLPGLAWTFADPALHNPIESTRQPNYAPLPDRPTTVGVGSLLAGAAGAGLYYSSTMKREDNLTFENPNRTRKASDFGPAGAIFGALSNQVYGQSSFDSHLGNPGAPNTDDGMAVVDVTVAER